MHPTPVLSHLGHKVAAPLAFILYCYSHQQFIQINTYVNQKLCQQNAECTVTDCQCMCAFTVYVCVQKLKTDR